MGWYQIPNNTASKYIKQNLTEEKENRLIYTHNEILIKLSEQADNKLVKIWKM